MKDVYTQEQIEEMRKRLYDRGSAVDTNVRHQLTDTKIDVERNWATSEESSPNTTDLRVGALVDTEAVAEDEQTSRGKIRRRHYRSFILIGSLLIFVLVAGASSLYLYFGGNQISSDNIQISVQGPFSISGGEVMAMQVGVTNQNTVPIESATLIVKYPPGTRSVGDSPRNLYEERFPMADILPDQTENVPINVAVFGEENTEQKVNATIEYRVQGSNGMFYKDAEPLVFRISSSPLVIRVESVEKVASGQLVDITLTAVSNASTPLSGFLITASYPNGFTFETSTPEPVYGQNVWRIDELLPEQTATIELKGVVSGLTDDAFRLNFSAGPTDPNNQFALGATLAEARADFTIERPFIDVSAKIMGSKDRVVILPEGQRSTVAVKIKNTLDETVYDMVVEVVPGGNALDEASIRSNSGFYDSNTGTVRWEVSNNSTFDRIVPGETRDLTFEVLPGPTRTTASFELVVNVYARRVAESSAAETLIGTARTEAKYSSHISLGSQAAYSAGPYVGSGPIPPKVGETTSYVLSMIAEAGANDMTNAVAEASLPLYVNWLDEYQADGAVTYNAVNKQLQWVIGDIRAGERKEFTFQVNLTPSDSQLKLAPILLNSQVIRGNDRFTGELLQDNASAVTTDLSSEMGYSRDNGLVVQ